MGKPTQTSVTEVPCSCGYLARSARNPRFSVRFDTQFNEYYFDHKLPSGATFSMLLYHCPMCGGVASESKRSQSFATLTEEEILRVDTLIHDLQTVQDIDRALGTPDRDETFRALEEFGLVQPETGQPETGSVRTLTYTRLSQTADVQFTVYSNSKIDRAIYPKFVGAPPAKRRATSGRKR